jgi:hypothetical protein
MEFYHKWGIAKDPQDAANLVEREVRRRRRVPSTAERPWLLLLLAASKQRS